MIWEISQDSDAYDLSRVLGQLRSEADPEGLADILAAPVGM